MPEMFVTNYQIDTPLVKVSELDFHVPCFPGVVELQGEVQEKQHAAGTMPGRFWQEPFSGT